MQQLSIRCANFNICAKHTPKPWYVPVFLWESARAVSVCLLTKDLNSLQDYQCMM